MFMWRNNLILFFSCTEFDKYLITSSSLWLTSSCHPLFRISQWPAWLTLLWHDPLCCQPMKWWLICFSLGWLSFKSLSKRHRHTHTYTHVHPPPSTTKSKQDLSGCSELCLMQQDERCCHVVKSWSMWSWQVCLSNNKSRTQVKKEGKNRVGNKKGATQRSQTPASNATVSCPETPKRFGKKYTEDNMVVTRQEKCKETWCIASGQAVWMGSAAASPTRGASGPESWSQPQHTLEQSNKDCI